jgi:uncharacterized membrane protein YeiH
MTGLILAPLTDLLDFVGTFAFALSGAIVGIRRGMDFFGVVVLGFLTAVAGGIIRDVLIGSLPPDALQSWHGLAFAVLAGALTFFVGGPIARLHWLVRQFDAVGLAMFCVIGANKALAHGLMPVMAAVLGMVTAVGGGVARDIMAAQIPTVLTTEIYAVAALLGASVVAAGPAMEMSPATSMLLGAALCLVLRLLSMHGGWRLPVAVAVPLETRDYRSKSQF